jgi:hypothetical protein
VLSGFRIIAGPTVQLAEAEVAVGDERTHPKLVGPGESLAVVRVGGLQVKRIGLGDDLTEEADDPRLVAALLLPLREIDGALSDRPRVVAELRDAEKRPDSARSLDRLLQDPSVAFGARDAEPAEYRAEGYSKLLRVSSPLGSTPRSRSGSPRSSAGSRSASDAGAHFPVQRTFFSDW